MERLALGVKAILNTPGSANDELNRKSITPPSFFLPSSSQIPLVHFLNKGKRKWKALSHTNRTRKTLIYTCSLDHGRNMTIIYAELVKTDP